jgi:hypothetical protein
MKEMLQPAPLVVPWHKSLVIGECNNIKGTFAATITKKHV